VRLRVPVVPDTYSPITRRRLRSVATQISVFKSLYLSAKWKGFFLVTRGTKVKIERGAKVHLDPGAFFCIGFANRTAMSASLHLGLGAEVVVHGTAMIQRGCRVFVHNGGRLTMGSRSYVNDCSTLTCFEEVSIGSGCSISWNTNIMDTNVHELSIEGVPRPRTSPVRIEDGVWVGAGATILPGVTVGTGAVIAAASVVTADVPPGVLVAGNPARVIRRNVTWEQ
jgi:acetyltransferase-like isoleucine patch superfamily enzyme